MKAAMRRNAGFTLIELMIAVAIVAILAAIAIPSYTEYVRRSRIIDATSALSGMRVKMEQYFQDNRSYVAACGTTGVAAVPQNTTAFDFTCPTLSSTQYEIRATGKGSVSPAIYTINQAGVRATLQAPAGWTNPSTSCGWVVKKDGSC